MDFRKRVDGRVQVTKGFNVSAFFQVLGEVVAARKSNWKLLAKEIGLSPSTLSRMGQGRCPDAATLAALSAWAGLNPADFVAPANGRRTSSLAAISGVLRSDPNLEPKAMQALDAIIRAVYAGFEQTTQAAPRAGVTGPAARSIKLPAQHLADRTASRPHWSERSDSPALQTQPLPMRRRHSKQEGPSTTPVSEDEPSVAI
jgi:hypothetical protein